MAKAIWKFTLSESEKQFSMPTGARILSADEQHGQVCIWAEVDPAMDPEDRRFSVYGTGHGLPDNPGRFIGTVKLASGAFIMHVYEQT